MSLVMNVIAERAISANERNAHLIFSFEFLDRSSIFKSFLADENAYSPIKYCSSS